MPLVARAKRHEWQDPSPPASLRLTYLIARKHEPQMRKAFLDGMADIRDSADWGQALENQSDPLALFPDLSDPLNAELWQRIGDRYRVAYRDTIDDSADRNFAEVMIRFGGARKRDAIRTENTDAYIESTVGDRIVAINTSQKAAIKVMVQAGIDAGRNPRIVARNIREVVGLLPREVEMVERRRGALLAQGMEPERAEKMTARYAAKKLKDRAERIARTEMIDAESFGRLEAWKEGQRAGLIPHQAYRVWVAAGPPRTCPICESLDGQVTETLTSEFSADFEKTLRSGETVTVTVVRERPPAHPMCRCSDELVVP